ncbi:MAG: hypothetical protein SO083_06965 [Megamonas funiformis]|uniref:hypothetical protein n=1 Tax=Megamonas funiformis TaxID=437897 RepID=UPI002A7F0F43|nr:hypothetical protein [Megamonas funiformis]MDY3874891.1 hypothetical protein [Megamonas funiformis]
MINTEFKKAILSEDIIAIKSILIDSLVIDPTAKTFDELLLYAKENLKNNLIDIHDGEILIDNENEWNIDYLNKQMVKVLYNFSNERIQLIKNMCKIIYKDKILSQKKVKNEYPLNNIPRRRTYKVRKNNRIGIKIIVGLVILIILIIIVNLFSD